MQDEDKNSQSDKANSTNSSSDDSNLPDDSVESGSWFKRHEKIVVAMITAVLGPIIVGVILAFVKPWAEKGNGEGSKDQPPVTDNEPPLPTAVTDEQPLDGSTSLSPEDVEELQNLIKTHSSIIIKSADRSVLQQRLTEYCSSPSQEKWNSIQAELQRIEQELMGLDEKLTNLPPKFISWRLPNETSDADGVVENEGTLFKLSKALGAKRTLVQELRQFQYPHSPEQLQRIQNSVDEFRQLVTQLKDVTNSIQAYLYEVDQE